MEITTAETFVENVKARGVELRFEGKVLKTKPRLTSEEIVFASQNLPAIYKLLTGEDFEIEEHAIQYVPPKPEVSPMAWVDRVRAHTALKSTYWQWPEVCLTGRLGTYDEWINPKRLPSLLEALERPENKGAELFVADMYAFSINGVRKDGSPFTVERFSYDGTPCPVNQRHLYKKKSA